MLGNIIGNNFFKGINNIWPVKDEMRQVYLAWFSLD